MRLDRIAAAIARRPAARSAFNRAVAPSQRFFSEAHGLGSEIPKKLTPKEKKPRQTFGIGHAVGATSLLVGAAYVASDDVRDSIDEFCSSAGQTFEDFNDSSREFFDGIADTLVSKKQEPWLLDLETMKYPDNIPTLIVDLDKVILHLGHDSRQGWHVVKRPFADKFFKELSLYYELVIFSDDVFPVALDIAEKWQLPVAGVLHRDFCKKRRNKYVKDLSKLGRKMDRVLIIDHDSDAFQLQPENGIKIKPFEGDTSDSELADLVEFLKAAAVCNQDLREFVKKYGGGDEDIGRRFLIEKQVKDAKIESRRSFGRAFASSSRGLPAGASAATPFGPGGFR